MSGKPTVLVVDDPETRGAVAERFEGAGIDVEIASDVKAATDALTGDDFDCAVSRDELPDGEGGVAAGTDVIRALRGVDGVIPVVLFGEGRESVASDAVAAGLADYVSVGGDESYDRLVGRIRNAVSRRQAVRRAEQQARTNEVIRDVNQALVRADSRERIEESVCEQFARSEQYTFAWIAGVDDNGLTFRAMGVEGGAVEGRGTFSVDEGTAFTEPVYRAAVRRDVVVLRDVGDRGGAWEAALDHPFEAVAAVPFVYDDEVYGVLLLYTDRHGAFGEDERQVLAELGANVAYALNAVAVRRKSRLRELQLRRKNEQLEEFAEVVSHDLRNPLTVASGYVRLLEGDQEAVETIDDSLSRMEAIIDDVLALARQGRAVGETELVDLAVAAEEAWSTVETGDATLDADGDLVEADRSRLVQLLENLFRNAIEHGSADTVRVEVTDDGFTVEDDGVGLPDEEDAELFQSGYTTADDGTGFGLAIVRSIAEAHGWDVATDESTLRSDSASEAGGASGGSAERSAGGARFVFTGVGKPDDDDVAVGAGSAAHSENVTQTQEDDTRPESAEPGGEGVSGDGETQADE